MSVNFTLGDFVSQWRVATLKHVKFASLKVNTSSVEPLIKILYENGIIRSFRILKTGEIIVYFKYDSISNKSFNLSIVSTPGHRVYWSLSKLSNRFNYYNFSGFYIISTKQGLFTSTDCLFYKHIGGEILLKVEI